MALVLASLVTGCPAPDPVDSGTYVYDPYGNGTIEREPACKLTGTLEPALGDGSGAGAVSRAAGTHVILGVHVAYHWTTSICGP